MPMLTATLSTIMVTSCHAEITAFDWSGTVDGNNPATEWKGLHDLDEMIIIKNPGNGWIQNCNSTPFTAAAEFSPKQEDYPRYMAYDTENARGIHAVMVLKDKKDFTLDRLLEAAYDSYLPGFEESIPAVVAAYDVVARTDRTLREKLAGPVEALRNWDLRYSIESVPMSIAHYYSQAQARQPRNQADRSPAAPVSGREDWLRRCQGCRQSDSRFRHMGNTMG
jgi:acyl-homoserine-lactone acylase